MRGRAKAGVKLLEPIMDVEVGSGDFVGSVIGDPTAGAADPQPEMRGNATVRANAAANMFAM
jgi:hypothetical protein